ncbi:hypothetical protein NE237_022081 [Protea cynaroides]|uniref:Uncharacterized protein n=1 Tax=Protea cynaroides TaxID=273540 RepID=A0A9Q0HDP6_9MAGN|nr:hypothetical protein NE237_022081 [Protea cynaroides]
MNMAQNIALLRENGVPESNIVTLITYYPRTTAPKNDLFKQRVEEIKQMGFDLSNNLFVIALHVFTSMNKSTWKKKLEVYQRWGFSQNEVLLAFRKHPWFMSHSEKKIMRHMDFFVNKMGCEQAIIITYPYLLGYSLEKRILPRCSVLRVLILKGLVKENCNMGSLIITSEKHFLEKFVTKYENEFPQLLDLYKGNTSSLLGFRYGIEEVDGKNLM